MPNYDRSTAYWFSGEWASRITLMPKDQTPLGPCEFTSREFEIIHFRDRYGTGCTLQQSSIFDDEYADRPGATAVWLGPDEKAFKKHDGMMDVANATRMHLDRPKVKALIVVLEQWLANGHFTDPPIPTP